MYLSLGNKFIPFFITFGLYRTIFRYSGFYSFLYIFNAVLIFNIFFSLILYFSKIPLINLSFVIVYSILLFFLIFSSRVFISFFVASLSNSKDKNYTPMSANFDGSIAFKTACDLIF